MDVTAKVIGDRVISVYEANIGKDGTSVFSSMDVTDLPTCTY
jgi:hypothetical protein